jgi:hypothetical protein
MAETKYYLIRQRRLGKATESGNYLFVNGKWAEDERNVIRDHLMGFDPNDDSFYGFGNALIMDEMEEITEEDAIRIMNEQIQEGLK